MSHSFKVPLKTSKRICCIILLLTGIRNSRENF